MKQIKQLIYEALGADLTYYESYEKFNHKPDYCLACCKVISGTEPAYIDERDDDYYGDMSFHKSCAESPVEILHPLHPHPLTVKYSNPDISKLYCIVCDVCRQLYWGFIYTCEDCNFKLDFQCVCNPHIQLKHKTLTSTTFHQHRLQLLYCDSNNRPSSMTFNEESFCCCYCSEGFKGSLYSCIHCQLFIHESCINKVQLQVTSPFHQRHPLSLAQSERPNTCLACAEPILGLMLSCDECWLKFHIYCCAKTTSGLRLKFHEEHPLLYLYKPPQCLGRGREKCIACNNICESATYSCLDCKLYIHMECIPLPRVIKHECHPYHPLTLTISDSIYEMKFSSKEYHCDNCEEKGYLKYPFYSCLECPHDIAHVDCVLSEVRLQLTILVSFLQKISAKIRGLFMVITCFVRRSL